MSILVNKNTKVICQGFTGTHGTFSFRASFKIQEPNLLVVLHLTKEVSHILIYQYFNTVPMQESTGANATMICSGQNLLHLQ